MKWQPFIFSLLFGLAACSGGGGGTSSSGGSSGGSSSSSSNVTVDCTSGSLCPPSKVSVVPAESSSSTNALKYVYRNLAAPTQGAYIADKTEVFTENPSQEAFDTVNMILCVINKTKYSDFTQTTSGHPFLALVDMNACETKGSNKSSSQDSSGSSSSSSMPKYMQIIADPYRVDANSIQYVNVWVTMDQSDPMGQDRSQLIKGKLQVTQSPTTNDPYGKFRFDWAGYNLENGVVSNTISMKGFIKTLDTNGVNQIQFAENETMDMGGGEPNGPDGGSPGGGGMQQIFSRSATFVKLSTDSGYGITSNSFSGTPIIISTAFKDNLMSSFYEQNNTPVNLCYNRDNFYDVVYQYGVYDTNGDRVKQNSGFPIRMTINGREEQGWLGYYGMWIPGNISPTNGMTVTKVGFGPDSVDEEGTLVVGEGRLNLNQKKILTLADFDGTEIDVWGRGGSESHAIITWSKNNNRFEKVANEVCNWNSEGGGCKREYLTEHQPLGENEFDAIGIKDFGGMLNLNMRGMGGGSYTQLQLFDCFWTFNPGPSSSQRTCTYNPPSNTTQLVTWTNQPVSPTIVDNELILLCNNYCPVKESANGEVLYVNPQWDPNAQTYNTGVSDSVVPAEIKAKNIVYRFNKNIISTQNPYVLTLYGNSNIKISPNQSESNNMNNSSGGSYLHAGPLIIPSEVANLPINQWDGTRDYFKIFDGAVNSFYDYNSGSNQWDRLVTFKSSNGAIAELSPPKILRFTKSSGGVEHVEYMGWGQLHGIPGKCVDRKTGEETYCNQDTNWVPAYNIPAGTELTDINTNIVYYIKPLAMAQVAKPLASTASCSSIADLLGLAQELNLPSINAWSDPSLGDKPAGITTPRVIDGVVQ